MNPEATAAWVGRKLRYWEKRSRSVAVEREFTLLEVIGEGAHQVKFRVAGPDGDSVIGFPRNHIGFLIRLPPDRLFPEMQADGHYAEHLLEGISALQGSTAASMVSPLDGLWNALAVQHLRGHEGTSVKADEYGELRQCDLVVERLADWSTADVGRDGFEIIVVHERERPVLASPACVLAKDAQAALLKIGTAVNRVRENPLLLWIAAGASAYTLPPVAISAAVATLREMKDADLAMKQAQLVLRYAGHHAEWEDRMALLEFINRVDSQLRGDSGAAGDVLLKMIRGLLGR
jgi:hypothetical protein